MHHLAGLVQTLSFSGAHTQTTQAQRWPVHTFRGIVAHIRHKICFTVTHRNSGDLYKELIRPFKRLQEVDDSHTPNTTCEIQGQKVRRRSQHTVAVMWSKLRVETEIAEQGSTTEQPLGCFVCPLWLYITNTYTHVCLCTLSQTHLLLLLLFFSFLTHKVTKTVSLRNTHISNSLKRTPLFCTITLLTPHLPALTSWHYKTRLFCPEPFPCSHSGAELQPLFKSHSGRQYKWSCFPA